MSGRLYDAGVTDITNIDFSSVCVSLLNDRYARLGLGAIQNTVMDARSMEFTDASLDAVIDKVCMRPSHASNTRVTAAALP